MTQATAASALACAAMKRTSAWGSSRCGRPAVAILRNAQHYEPICKLHLSIEARRAKRYQWTAQLDARTLPVDDALALAALAKDAAERQARAEQRAAEDRIQALAAREHRLIYEQQEVAEHWLVKRDDQTVESWSDNPDRIVPRWTWTTTTDDDSRGYYSRELTVERSYKDDARFPAYVVARNSNGTLTPREARALAQALLAAADVADQQPGAQPEKEA